MQKIKNMEEDHLNGEMVENMKVSGLMVIKLIIIIGK